MSGTLEQPTRTGLSQLPLRELGFENAPAIPVDVDGIVDTLITLGVKAAQYEQALQGLTNEFTIGGSTARAYTFLYGDEPPDTKRGSARERLSEFLRGSSSEIVARVAATRLDQPGQANDSGHDLTRLSLEDPRQWSMGWTTHPDAYSLGLPRLDEFAATVDVEQPDKATEAFFPTIARYGRSYNLILPKKVHGDDLAMCRELFGSAWRKDLEAASAAGLLYVIDMRIYEFLEPHEVAGSTRFTPSTVTILVQDAVTKALTPELIRVAGGGNEPKIFDRQGSTTPSAWVYALQAAKVSATVFGVWLGHVYQLHLVTAAMLMTMFESLPADNPARRLLQPHSDYVIPFDDIVLLQWDATAPPTSIGSGHEFLQLVDRYAANRTFFDDDPLTQLERLGISEADFTVAEPWDRYPIVGDLLEIWDATDRYVNVYVDRAYPTDGDIELDAELELWMRESGAQDRGNIRGLPAMDSKDALERVLRSILYRIISHGTSRLYRSANPVLTFVANFPPCLQDATIPDPTEGFDTKRLQRYLPNTGTIGEMLQFYFIFFGSPPLVPLVPLGGLDTDLFFDDEASNDALIELRRFAIDFVEKREPGAPMVWQWERSIEL